MKKVNLEIQINQEVELNQETILQYEKDGVKYNLYIRLEEITIANKVMKFLNEIKKENEDEKGEKGRAKRELKLTPKPTPTTTKKK